MAGAVDPVLGCQCLRGAVLGSIRRLASLLDVAVVRYVDRLIDN